MGLGMGSLIPTLNKDTDTDTDIDTDIDNELVVVECLIVL
jgi:hypothetical protein